MNTPKDLLGHHPKTPDKFGEWFDSRDWPVSGTKRHRALTALKAASADELVDWLARKLITHHYNDYRLRRLKQKYTEIGFSRYADQHRKLPRADRTKKGNATEILLTEYIESALGKPLVKVFKLKYNPNVDQAIKGDDTLLIDLVIEKDKEKSRIYLGESKFRSTPSKQAVIDIVDALAKDKKPLSLTFLIDHLSRTDEALADKIDDLIVDDIKGRGDLIYPGLLFSNLDTADTVEKHLISNNETMVFISIGMKDPQDLVDLSFEKAEYYIQNPDKL